jgi:hypothetical protein
MDMKKVMSFLAIAAMVLVASCNKNPKPDPKPTPEPEPEPEPEYVAPITIDGDSADWAKLDASKVAVTTCNPDSKLLALKTVKVYADEQFIFLYVEYDPMEDEWIPFHVYMNADNSAETGGYGDEFAEADAEWLLETSITAYDCALFKWWGEAGGNGWNWTDPEVEPSTENGWGAILPEGSGFGTSAGDASKGKYEISIMRAMIEEQVKFADTFTLGFDIQANWSSVGILPNAPITDENPNGLAPKLRVNVVK